MTMNFELGRSVHERAWTALSKAAERFRIVLVRTDPSQMFGSREWDILCDELYSPRIAGAIFRSSDPSLLVVATHFAPLSVRLVILDREAPSADNRLILDIRGPILAANSGAVILSMSELSFPASAESIYFLDSRSDIEVNRRRNRLNGSDKGTVNLRLAPDLNHLKSGLGPVCEISNERRSETNSSVRLLLIRSRSQKFLRAVPPSNFSLHGPDGVGKSSCLNLVAEVLSLDRNSTAQHYFESLALAQRKPTQLPILSGRKLVTLRAIRFLWHSRREFVSNKVRDKGKLRLHDRHLYDFIDKQAKSQRRVGRGLSKSFAWLQARVTTPLLLVEKADVIRESNQELTISQIDAVYERLSETVGGSAIREMKTKGWSFLNRRETAQRTSEEILRFIADSQKQFYES